ncbi:MAG TPA: hypothetical protein VFY67_14190, partial [Pyrinomonadaceae bacterium]|nr:hypothetical protein [Pyrinomonadaceae bacterium]
MDYLESDLRQVGFPAKAQRTRKEKSALLCVLAFFAALREMIFKNGFAPRGALLAALWGDKPRRKA